MRIGSSKLHPNLAEVYRQKVERLHEALQCAATRHEALEILRALIDKVTVRHQNKVFEIELVGEIANMVALSAGTESTNNERFRRSVKVVAGARYLLCRNRRQLVRAR